MEIIVGTAGHIDHGKTALIKALTGIDADRLPEEKRRGITVDIGFAEMRAGDVHFGFVDVPGHERFVKNMLAGASGIDIVMLVIAADEGVMPQTREHFDICRLLGVRSGIVVLTKTDIVDAETLDLARLEVAELVSKSFLENAPVIAVSSLSGAGIDELRATLPVVAALLPPRNDRGAARMPIDRSFSIKGFGAVVTGTLASGEFRETAEMELHPGGERVRMRGLQTHGENVSTISAGQRVAVNLGGIDHKKISRGMVLAEPDTLRPTQIIDAEIDVLPVVAKAIRSRQRCRVHIGTVEVLARVHVLNDAGKIESGGKDYAQLRLEMPVATVPGERFILRSYSPQTTIAGGRAIDIFPGKHRRRDVAKVRVYLGQVDAAADDDDALIGLIADAAGAAGITLAELQVRTGLNAVLLTAAIDRLIGHGKMIHAPGIYIVEKAFAELCKSVESAIREFHRREPLAKGVSREVIRDNVSGYAPPEIFQAIIASMVSAGTVTLEKETIRLTGYKATLEPEDAAVSEKIYAQYRDAGLAVPKLDEALDVAIEGTRVSRAGARKLFQLSLDAGKLVKITDEFYFTRSAIDELIDLVRQFAAGTSDRLIDVSRFKEIAGISRKYAIPLLEYLDREHITSRAGDKRLVL